MNDTAILNDDAFVEICDADLEAVNGGGVGMALTIFLAAAAVGYAMGSDWAQQDR